MRVLLLSMNFYPEPTGTGPVIANLARELKEIGHEVTIVAGFPYYPKRIVPERYRGKFMVEEEFEGMRCIRTWIYCGPETRAIDKILHHTSFSISSFFGALKAGKQDVIIAVSPPLFEGITGWMISKIRRAPMIFRIEDMLPDAAIIYNLITNKTQIRILKWIEKFIYKRSQKIIAICNGFVKNLREKQVPEEKIVLIPHWADIEHIIPMEKYNGFRKANGIENQFLAIYSGNIGLSQGLEVILEAAKLLAHEKNIQFMIIGDGVQKKALLEKAERERINNVKFLPVQPKEILPNLLAAADVSLVTQKPNVLNINVPSKIFNIMASGRPMLVGVNPKSDAAEIVRRANCGILFKAGDEQELANAILKLYRNPELAERLGQNGRKYVEKYYTRQASINSYKELLNEVSETLHSN